ncbi:MAG TPA: primosomal protein N', partial [Candidatus Portnoybacteria bacterium]|nr:primosomal protein N' [Candidatus Portnoybacteria bacterium]
MKIVEVIPATKIPLDRAQVYTYYTGLSLEKGSLVLVPLARRKVPGVVIQIKDLESHKLEIKKADFKLKSIYKIISQSPVLTTEQLKLAQWLARYAYVSLGLIIKTILPKIPKRAKPDQELFKEKNEQQTIILVPEISLIPQAVKKYAKSQEITVYHRELGLTKYYQAWQKIISGRAKIIIGPRSAIFAPVKNLEKIIITQEHDPSYKSSEQAPRYDARKVAQKLAQLTRAKLILESPTPSIETYYQASQNKYQLKVSSLSFPSRLSIVDMKEEIAKGNYSIFSYLCQEAIEKVLRKKQKAILFINRRGTATFIICRDCGYVVKCPLCEVPLVYHILSYSQKKDKLICHHCNHHQEAPTLCPKCQSHRIKYFGTGTQRVETEVKKLFPSAKVVRLDSDLPEKIQTKVIQTWLSQQADVLVGTQMIARIPDLPKISLVGVITADTILHLPDFKASERTFQMISQIVSLGNEAIIQTYNPESSTFQAIAKREAKSFYQKEIQARKALAYPPFSQLVK